MGAESEKIVDESDKKKKTTAATAEESKAATADEKIADLQGQLELVQAENERLRQEYVRSQQTKYRRTAIVLVIVGVIAISGAVLFQSAREVLIALGGAATIAGVLTYYLTPEKFVVATVGETLTETLQSTYEAIRTELDLQGEPVYVPAVSAGDVSVRLFFPQQPEYTLPDEDSLTDMFVLPENRRQWGIAVRPSSAGLFEEFRAAAVDFDTQATNEPLQIFEQLADGLVEQFELADQVTASLEDETRCVLAVTGSTYSHHEKIDHPVPSFIAVGAATAFNEPTRINVRNTGNRDFIIECQWGVSTETREG